MAVGCHPDDIEIGCGGTLAKYARQGQNVFMCHIANGDKGHAIIMPDELKETRRVEAENAGNVIGVKEVISLDVPDLEVNSYSEDTVNKMIDLIRYVKPDVIITHSTEDYMQDHLEVGRLVFNASFSSSVPHTFTSNPAYGTIPPIFFMDTLAGVNFLPAEYVDISEHIETKLKALNCHQSQIKWMLEHDEIDFLDFIGTVWKFRGLQCGVKYAECFCKCETWPRLVTHRILP